MSQNSQDAIDVLSKVIVDTIEKKLNDAKFDKSQTGVVTAVNGNTYTISVFGSQYNITSDQIYTVGQSVVVTALQGDMKRLVCSPDNIGTMKTVDSKVNVVGSQLSTFIDTDFADTIIKYTDVSEFLTLKDQMLKNDKEVLDLYRSKLLSIEEHQKEQDIVVEDHGRKIAGVEQRVNKSEHGINVMMKALLALLSHGIDGNAIDPMKEAKAALESYLIDGQNLKDI